MSRLSLSFGLTRAELIFLVVVFGILGVVSLGPILEYIHDVPIRRAVENARIISTLLSQYATDNEGVYPVGEGTTAAGKSEGIARNLLANNYTPDPGIFALSSTPRYRGKEADFADFTAQNISWDFTAGATATTGLTATAPDTLPVVYTTGESISFPVGTGLDVTLSGNGPFKQNGLTVAYKDCSVKFITGTNAVAPDFLSKSFTSAGPYTQIKP